MFICKYCGKECKNKKSLAQHEIRCKENPNKLIYEIPNFNNKGRIAWNKGLNINDERVLKYSTTNKENFKLGINKIWCEGLTKDTDERINNYVKKQKLNDNCGGYREGSGYGKQGTYKGIHCDSSWELAYLIYCLEHNIKIERFKKSFEYIDSNNIKHKYYPDFLINDNEIIEIKGYKTDNWKYKQDIVLKENIKVLYENDMLNILNYVENKYGKDFIKLYK